MGYSIIIPYRDRKEHLEILLPALIEKFKNEEYEIIVSEQDDKESFSISKVYNIGYQYSNYNNLIFNQVDYIPTKDVNYTIKSDCVLPAKKGIFLDKTNSNVRPYYDIPGGYRKWSTEIDSDFFGGVICIKKSVFEQVNGFNPLYNGWGNEDEDFRERLKHYNIKYTRNHVGTFYCLYHKDNGDFKDVNKKELPDFIKGKEIYHNFNKYLSYGINNLKYDSEIEYIDIDSMPTKLIWIKSKNYKII
jgi:predicted glycosyltransferase involved in capsule biosynthesis